MKKQLLIKMTLALLFVQLMACQKLFDVDDLWHKNNPDCRIEEIKYAADFGIDTVIGKFSYNNKGNPTSVMFNFSGTGRPHLLFRYDNKGRLTDYIGPYLHNSNAEFWFHFEHDFKGRIISDSVHVFGSYVNGQPQSDGTIRSSGVYEYDVYDRVVKITRTFPGYVNTFEYTYNADHNLEKMQRYFNGIPDYAETYGSYDNKVNIHRTSKVWMFVDRNYSKNNARVATSYNSKGLPLKYDLGETTYYSFLYEMKMNQSQISYKCK